MNAHQALLDMIEAQLAPLGVALQRHSTRPMPEAVAQMVSLRILDSQGSPLLSEIEWRTRLGVLCLARSITTTADQAVAALLEAVHTRITAAPLLAAGYRLEPEYGLRWDQDDIDERLGAVELTYTVRHIGALTIL